MAIEVGNKLKGKVTGVGYGQGNTLQTIKDNWGWFFVLPVVLILIVEIIFVIRNINASLDYGEVMVFNLMYSGNHYNEVEMNTYGNVRVSSGISPFCFDFSINPAHQVNLYFQFQYNLSI